jgi:plastocyanin
MRPSTVLTLAVALVAGAGAAGAADHGITQQDRSFSEKAVTVKAGDRLVFTNADSITHNIYSVTPGHEFELKIQKPGQSDTVPFAKAGSLEVQCAIHPKMKLQVTVTP